MSARGQKVVTIQNMVEAGNMSDLYRYEIFYARARLPPILALLNTPPHYPKISTPL